MFKSFIVIAMGGVMGWYSFGHLGWWGVITAGYFTVIGWLLAKSWTNPEKNNTKINNIIGTINSLYP